MQRCTKSTISTNSSTLVLTSATNCVHHKHWFRKAKAKNIPILKPSFSLYSLYIEWSTSQYQSILSLIAILWDKYLDNLIQRKIMRRKAIYRLKMYFFFILEMSDNFPFILIFICIMTIFNLYRIIIWLFFPFVI